MKTIKKIEPMMHGHMKLTFDDETTKVIMRGQHLKRGANGAEHDEDPVVGDGWSEEDGVVRAPVKANG